MFRSMLKILGYASMVLLVSLLLVFFIPRNYDVSPFRERPDTQYWELETGSRIGYTLLRGDTSRVHAPIIYLHGGPGGMIQDEVVEFFRPIAAAGYDVYLYDQIGSGHSDRLSEIGDYSVARHRADLEAIVARIGAERVILFGHSWGSMLATEFLAGNREKVESMILSGPGPILPIKNELAGLKAPDSLQLTAPKYSNREGNERANNLRSKLVYYWARIFKRKLASDREADQFFTHLNNQLSKSTTCNGEGLPPYPGGGGYYVHMMTVNSFYEVKDKRSAIRDSPTPLLIIKGQCDNQKWGFLEEYLRLFPNSRYQIIPAAGHRIDPDRFDEYRKIVLDFLHIQLVF
ncbi:alpha/beta hydrolase [Flavilitoribacter nigricans]|uniref:AB hydrolase-1 domain-containing protein n=1 Tax=Flavilitoribacter nigricans (strain ATCC 23147 / DSM 23189 / NBRC 102662 / NCIMB 1420 / SS-2) TaxID=1122177 RepID=A0A2D0NGX3_FLAN2|nr:alpha/beta hydrolase [Flavilitoribacter nigricans]PHN07013.1 hypothetical protein CRP01_08620 [Flavilitoribacter nigricans DSM 23189 = NBRC 102662]